MNNKIQFCSVNDEAMNNPCSPSLRLLKVNEKEQQSVISYHKKNSEFDFLLITRSKTKGRRNIISPHLNSIYSTNISEPILVLFHV